MRLSTKLALSRLPSGITALPEEPRRSQVSAVTVPSGSTRHTVALKFDT